MLFLALDSVSLCLAHLDDILDLGLHRHRVGGIVTGIVQDLVKTCSGPVTTEEKGDQPPLAVCYRPSADNPATGDTGLIEQRWTRVTRVSLLVLIGVVTPFRKKMSVGRVCTESLPTKNGADW